MWVFFVTLEYMSSSFSFDYFGSTIHATPLGVDFVPPLSETLTAHCLPLTADGKIVSVDIVGRGIDIPGGHIEDGESAIEAMQRETKEEAMITVDNVKLIDVWHLTSDNAALGLAEKPHILLYKGLVTSVGDFTPNSEVSKRLLLTQDEFLQAYYGGKAQAQLLLDAA